ncbi:hypothetical protein GCM10009809_04060 [Isoptericola hypogeus]|uniref:DUF4352 domain-containing protein n=1 Tax=Isoptericola hypogeus TaxID=300179 RepID=A0ABN2ISP7_9MICO
MTSVTGADMPKGPLPRVGGISAALASVAVLVAACSGSPDVVVAEGSDRYPNLSATDWVTYADHVVVATVVTEREIPLSAEEEAAGEGSMDRHVTLSIDEVSWTSADPRHPAPAAEIDFPAWGWAVQDGEKIPMAGDDTPRLEIGHTYVLALVWEPAIDDPTTPIPARWVTLGADSVLPYEGGIGVGELEGARRSQPVSVSANDPNFSLEDELAGESVSALVGVLDAAEPGTRENYGPTTE